MYKNFVESLTDKYFLKKINLTKKAMMGLIRQDNWEENVQKVLLEDSISPKVVLDICRPTLDHFSGEPDSGWLDYIYNHGISSIFPESAQTPTIPSCEPGRLFYLEVLRVFLRHERLHRPFNPILNMEMLSDEEINNSPAKEEYNTLLHLFKKDYIYEFMRIGSDITRFNTLAHISGVHYVALHVGRQLLRSNMPVDLALVSGSAAGHDIGKYGCKPWEEARTPYLHYYYTDKYFKQHGMPTIGHIATNHSTWDLELENLSVESLILIYADFRVKSYRDENGIEQINFYSLKESFDVILNKLDNVDQAKLERYIRVYAKLKDFEDYMVELGINTDLSSSGITPKVKKDYALLDSHEIVAALKNQAIHHNIFLMHKLNSERIFGNILEAARSDKDWKNIRAYINIFEEYFTYITQKQKIMTLNFLYELLMHREGDIRRQAADLLGKIIVHFDVEYRKEIPQGARIEDEEISSMELWKKYLNDIILPDHKVTEQHKRWIGYTLKLIVGSVLSRCKKEDRMGYLDELLKYYSDANRDDSTAFILLDTILELPLDLCSYDEKRQLITFINKLSSRESLEIQIACLRVIKYLTGNSACNLSFGEEALEITGNIKTSGVTAIDYLKYKIRKNRGVGGTEEELRLFINKKAASEIFLENLKVATPWVIKSVNIELLLDQVTFGHNTYVLHVATHLSNLIKVSERVAVRHSAGKALLEIAPLLSLDQRNEVVIELTKGLEIGEYEFSKYIPEYLGELALFLHPEELDEFVKIIKNLAESTNERVASVSLNTLGIMLQKYPIYKQRFPEDDQLYLKRRELILGILLKGLADYHDVTSREAFLVIGQYIFGSTKVSIEEKSQIFSLIYKKLLTLITDQVETELSFYNNAASLNHIYRFISDYLFINKEFQLAAPNKVAFFPGTFDPFSLSHKGIVDEIKNLGFEVFLALDEFSWSKKTQPRMIRRKLISMSIASEMDVYLFPDNIPVNIANPEDLKRLREIFSGKELFIVVGSDVIYNASSYKSAPGENTIHQFNHIIFRRDSRDEILGNQEKESLSDTGHSSGIKGKILELSLPIYLEDISSTRIRENIDYNRDISNLIDPIAQNYIYDHSLYLREPQYKHIVRSRAIRIEVINNLEKSIPDEMEKKLLELYKNTSSMKQLLSKEGLNAVLIKDGGNGNELLGFSTFYQIGRADLYQEFRSMDVAEYVRKNASGKIITLSSIVALKETASIDVQQLVLTETLAYCLSQDYTYAIYYDKTGTYTMRVGEVLKRQGFTPIMDWEADKPLLSVDMSMPITLIQDMETVIKAPFNSNQKILNVMEEAHKRLQLAITKLYPGSLVLSFNSEVMNYQLVNKITMANNVSCEPAAVKCLGRYMCVPFGKILRGMAVPNTVTKALHTEKIFKPEIDGFKIKEFPNYSPLNHQIRTIKSFNRPVLLVDDLLHKGYRLRELDPIFKEEGVDISKIIVGILSGRGKDLISIQNREVESVYFIPNLRSWFAESSMYPFIGGDSIKRDENHNTTLIPSINLILPYVAPNFLLNTPKEAFYNFSMVALENTRDILTALEEEYQLTFERNLTLNRLSEAIISPRIPDKGVHMSYDLNLSPSRYIANDIEKLIRIKKIII